MVTTQTHSDAARPKTINERTSSAEKSASRQFPSSSRKSSSANSEKLLWKKYVSSANQHAFQQRSVKASVNMLVHLPFLLEMFFIE